MKKFLKSKKKISISILLASLSLSQLGWPIMTYAFPKRTQRPHNNYTADNNEWDNNIFWGLLFGGHSEKECLDYISNKKGKHLTNKLINLYFLQSIAENYKILTQKFIELGANLDTKNTDGDTALIIAIKNHCNVIAMSLINAHNIDLNTKDKDGDTPLIIAIKNHCNDLAKSLIDHNIDLNEKDKNGNTALYIAYENDNIEIAKYLIDHGANFTTKKIYSGLIDVAFKKNSDQLKNLLLNTAIDKDNAKIAKDFPYYNFKTDVWLHKSMLFYAIKDGNISLAKSLISNGTNLNPIDNSGDRALAIAIRNNQTKIAMELIKRNVNLNVIETDKETPLTLAIKNGLTQVAINLISRGANLNVSDNNGDIPLALAIKKGQIEVATDLISYGSALNVVDNNGDTPLTLAIKNDMTQVAINLINRGANLNSNNKNGDTPLTLAIKNNQTEIAIDLIKRGVNLNVTNKAGDSPWLLAAKNGDLDVLLMLFSKLYQNNNFNINQQDAEGNTALLFACMNSDDLTTSFLLGNYCNNVDANLGNRKGETPLYWAVKNCMGVVSCLLLDKLIESRSQIEPLTLARWVCKSKDYYFFNHLIKENAIPLSYIPKSSKNLVHLAAENGFLDAIKFLRAETNHGNCFVQKDSNGNTPLMLACKNGHEDVVKSIASFIRNEWWGKEPSFEELELYEQALTVTPEVQKGIRGFLNSYLVELISLDQGLVLKAAEKGFLNTINVLDGTKHKECFLQVGSDGNTPLMLACKGKHKDIVEIITSNIHNYYKQLNQEENMNEERELYENALAVTPADQLDIIELLNAYIAVCQ